MATMARSSLINGKYFVLATFFPCSWYRAAHICNYNGMELASIESAAEQEVVRNLLDSSSVDGAYWTSGNDLGSAKSWYWLLNGSPITKYTNWGGGEPNNWKDRNERCLSLTPKAIKYTWNDVPCDPYSYHFICEGKYRTLGL